MSVFTRILAASFLALLLGSCGEKRPQNLVLISIDTLSRDRMSAYGGPRATTPSIDVLRERSLLFENAQTTSPWTLSAHASMLTGLYPSRIASTEKQRYGVEPMLGDLFKEAGYRTAAVTGGVYLSESFGFGQGFDLLVDGGVRNAIAWIEENKNEPFFLFFHTYIPHTPYVDRRFVSNGQGGRISEIFGPDDDSLHLDICCRGMVLSEEERAFLLALYDGGIAAADEAVGELLEVLRREGLLENTTVVITSDHGEEFWEHTGAGAMHGHTLYDELTRIPLIWYEPGLATAGGSVDIPVSLVDLLPTIAARFDLEAPDARNGLDISPVLDGEPWEVERPLFAEATLHGPERFSIRTSEGTLVMTPDIKKQRGLGHRYPVAVRSRQEVYLPNDPEERRNALRTNSMLAVKLLKQLREHRAQAVEVEEPDLSAGASKELEDQLRAMGYIE